jgi:hypothetical protein
MPHRDGPSLPVAEPADHRRGWGPLRVTPKRGLGPLQVNAVVGTYVVCSAYGSRLSDRRSPRRCAVETGRPHEPADDGSARWWSRGESNPRPTHVRFELQGSSSKPPCTHTIIECATAGDEPALGCAVCPRLATRAHACIGARPQQRPGGWTERIAANAKCPGTETTVR